MTPTLPSVISDFDETLPFSDFGEDFADDFAAQAIVSELGLWLAALSEFLDTGNHPFLDGNVKHAISQDWIGEMRVVRWALLKTAQLTTRFSTSKETFFNDLPDHNRATELYLCLSGNLILCEEILRSKQLGYFGWSNFAEKLRAEIQSLELFRKLVDSNKPALPPLLEIISTNPKINEVFGKEVIEVIARFNNLLEKLDIIGKRLEADEPLKSSLLLFALVHQESRNLFRFIEERILRFMPPEHEFFGLLDGTIYIVSMELRKVYSRELVGVSSVRPAPSVYARVETSHGLLQNCFQQSIVILAQAFEPQISGMQIFPHFQTRLEQSLILRKDLWRILREVQQAETAPDTIPAEKIHESLRHFTQNSMRFLMFKDCDETERFIEEVLRTRRLGEITHVLHRFGAYLETLLSQINMRTVLANYPPDFRKNDF